jgi:hypothetical protein
VPRRVGDEFLGGQHQFVGTGSDVPLGELIADDPPGLRKPEVIRREIQL